MNNFLRVIFSLSLAGLMSSSVHASAVHSNESDTSDLGKGQYSLFKHTPKDKMRDLSTDRPDKTESAYTVDAGHFQIETDIVNYMHDKESFLGSTTTVKSTSVMVSNLKVGLTNNIDLQVVVTPQTIEKTESTGSPETEKKGLGDTTVRMKFNLLGNDEGDIALALMPFVKIPTNRDSLGNDDIEGGLIFPVSVSLPNDWGMGLMFQASRNKNGADDEFHTEFVSSATIGHSIVGELSGYIEIFSESSSDLGAEWVATFDAGLTYKLTPDFQLDGGVNVGLTSASDDMNPFLGFSARF